MPFTPQETTVFLRAVREVKDFRNKFSEVADSIVDKIYSYYSNPNCTCKSTILDWINKNEPSTRELINTFKSDFDKLTETTVVPQLPTQPPASPIQANPQAAKPQQSPSNIKIGEFVIIEPRPEAYRELFTKAKNEHWVFRGIQVMPGDDDGKDVWIVLFY